VLGKRYKRKARFFAAFPNWRRKKCAQIHNAGGSIAIVIMWRRLFMADGSLNAGLALIGIDSNISLSTVSFELARTGLRWDSKVLKPTGHGISTDGVYIYRRRVLRITGLFTLRRR
jgi:hypothetical protein